MESSQLAVYIRHWHPSTHVIDSFQELVLSRKTVEELKAKVTNSLVHDFLSFISHSLPFLFRLIHSNINSLISNIYSIVLSVMGFTLSYFFVLLMKS